MFDCVPKTAVKKKESYMSLHNLYNFINCPVLIDIKFHIIK